jgi:predicted O-methyltransferase YrrM
VMNIEQLLTSPPKLHGPENAPTDGWRLDDAGLLFVDAHVRKHMRTIETGAGVSTILFALKGTRHTCIVPDPLVVRRIRQYGTSMGFSMRSVRFVVERSEYALPKLTSVTYDFALIDGRHGFPAPFIDWFYIADRLRPGGMILIDDTWIWTCEILTRFLEADPRWRRTEDLPNSAAFLKEQEDAQHAEWVDQPYVYQRSRAARYYPRSSSSSESAEVISRKRRKQTAVKRSREAIAR